MAANSTLEVGGLTKFGGHDWRVLDVRDGQTLIITEYIVEQRSYHDAYKDITWADCALRRYLNGEFYDRFSPAEKSRIVPVLNKNPGNHWYGTVGGEDTRDAVFLLSLEEAVCQYFGDSSVLLQNPKKGQRYWFERKDANNGRRLARLLDNKDWQWWWWLRTPGRLGVKAVYVHGTDGSIGIQGNNILKGNVADGRCTGGVRPAMWVTL